MIFFESFLVALSTYSTIPVPQFQWNDKNMKYAICFFPFVGIFCAVFLFAWYFICQKINLSGIIFSAVAVAISLIVTGGIHMDGFMDTMDALSSHAPKERKLEILKDSHCGAFAIIYCVMYIILNFGVFYELYMLKYIYFICPIYFLSRIFSALCAVNMPNARKEGMLCAYTKNTEKVTANVILGFMMIVAIAFIICLLPVIGVFEILFGIISLVYYKKMTMKQFGGVTGDTSGFFLQIFELTSFFGALFGVLVL